MANPPSETHDATNVAGPMDVRPTSIAATGALSYCPNDGVTLPDGTICEHLRSWSKERLLQAGVGKADATVHHLARIVDADASPFLREISVSGALSLLCALSPIPEDAVALIETLQCLLPNPGKPPAGPATVARPSRSARRITRVPLAGQEWSVRDVAIDTIVADHDVQPRVRLDGKVVEGYSDLMKEGVQFPPITVFEDQATRTMVVSDGFHRLAAARRAGAPSVRAEVRPGTRRDAVLFAAGANATHGLPRSSADKRRAVRLALGVRPELSDRALAELCAVSNTFVGGVRRQVSGVDTSPTPRIGQDGKLYSLPLPSRPEQAPAGAVPTPPEPRQAIVGCDADSSVGTPAADNHAEAVLPTAAAPMRLSTSTGVDPTAEQVLKTVIDTLTSAVTGSTPIDCLAHIASTLRYAHPVFYARIEHLLSVHAVG